MQLFNDDLDDLSSKPRAYQYSSKKVGGQKDLKWTTAEYNL